MGGKHMLPWGTGYRGWADECQHGLDGWQSEERQWRLPMCKADACGVHCSGSGCWTRSKGRGLGRTPICAQMLPPSCSMLTPTLHLPAQPADAADRPPTPELQVRILQLQLDLEYSLLAIGLCLPCRRASMKSIFMIIVGSRNCC